MMYQSHYLTGAGYLELDKLYEIIRPPFYGRHVPVTLNIFSISNFLYGR